MDHFAVQPNVSHILPHISNWKIKNWFNLLSDKSRGSASVRNTHWNIKCLVKVFSFRFRCGIWLGHSNPWIMLWCKPSHRSAGWTFWVVRPEGNSPLQFEVFHSLKQVFVQDCPVFSTTFYVPAETRHPHSMLKISSTCLPCPSMDCDKLLTELYLVIFQQCISSATPP